MTRSVGIVGAGTMGVGIAYVFLAAGFETIVAEPDQARAAALVRVIEEQAEKGRARGKLTDAQAGSLGERLHRVSTVDGLGTGLELIVESVPERIELKRAILASAERLDPEVLATNTSSLSIGLLAEELGRPEGLIGMHFFNPVWSLGLVELIRSTATLERTVEHAQRLVRDIGKEPIVVRDISGFATSRLDLIAALEAMRMLQDGVASAEDIDRAAVLAYRHPVGPLRLSDIVGLDVRLDIAESLTRVYGERFAPPQILRDKVAAGELGQKSGRGFFAWT